MIYGIFVTTNCQSEMKRILPVLFIVMLAGCKKEIEVTSIDQIPGLWKWESTCGGVVYDCAYGSKTNYATIEFRGDGTYIEKHNNAIVLQTSYTLIKYDGIYGSLILENPAVTRPITIINNALLITRGDLLDSYTKIKSLFGCRQKRFCQFFAVAVLYHQLTEMLMQLVPD